MKKTILIIVFIILVFAGFVFYNQLAFAPDSQVMPEVGTTDYLDATYLIEDISVTLKDGHSIMPIPDSEGELATDLFGNEARGDFNGDGFEDVVFILTQDGGGTGVFFYAAVALKTDGGYSGTNAVYLGDRIAPQTTEFRNGRIIINYADRKPGEPFTADPSVGVSKYLSIKNGKLVEVEN